MIHRRVGGLCDFRVRVSSNMVDWGGKGGRKWDLCVLRQFAVIFCWNLHEWLFFSPLVLGLKRHSHVLAVHGSAGHAVSSRFLWCWVLPVKPSPHVWGSFGTKIVRGIPAIYTSLVFLGGGARWLSVSLPLFSVLRHQKSGFISIKSIYLLIHFKQLSFISRTSIF